LVSTVWDISSGIGPCFPVIGEKLQIQHQPLLMQYKQQANPLLSMHNYTPLVISGNDNNKQLSLISQRKLALPALNTLFAL
jgi:hypothetical protein